MTLPGFAWDCLLRVTGVSLELLTDAEKHQFVERGLRGGVAMVTKCYATANNPNMNDYRSHGDRTHLLYLDANNLYGWAISQHLPVDHEIVQVWRQAEHAAQG